MKTLSFMITFLLTFSAFGSTFKPQSVSDLYQTSVRVYGKDMRRGGTGSIFKSNKRGSTILTNKHICRIIEQGGFVNYKERNYMVSSYKKFPQHDLCLIRINKNLNINLKIANTLIRKSSTVYVSGHPNLLPHIVTKGHVTDHMDIQLVIGLKKCTERDKEREPLKCSWFGGIPLVETFDSQVVSNLIKPGNSGSAVFNRAGEVVGVVYAGSGRGFSHGFIVPHLYLLFFVQNEHRFKWVKVGTKVDDRGVIDRIFDYEKCKTMQLTYNSKYKKIREFCRNIKDNVIWRK